MNLPRKHGQILFIQEINSKAAELSGASVRVLGKLISRDSSTNNYTIEYNESQLLVNVSLLGDVGLRIKSLYEFLGELEEGDQRQVVLKARIVRVMDGVDVALYDQAVKIRRKFEHFPTTFAATVHPVVFFSIIDHYLRRTDSQQRVIGALLGVRSDDGNQVEIRNCFPLPVTENGDDEDVVVDMDYFSQMYNLHQTVNSKEILVGWYATGSSSSQVSEKSVWLQEFFAAEIAPHQPIHLVVDTAMKEAMLGLRAYTSSPVGIPDVGATTTAGRMFIQVPCDLKNYDAEKSGLEIISMAKNHAQQSSGLLSDMDNLERSIIQVRQMLDTVGDYVDAVIAGQIKPNRVIGRYLMDTVSSIPKVDATEFERLFNNHLQDLLMVIYLANLTKSQLAIAERLQNLL
ncbi:hypothetical protein SmJEL517_g05440 [Synchytrium microbalum]|uniref:Eukaryotic translation initiation factor 3 subunit F n=1 Tax=Synchytrium microbalum TaxID=1806994 RepID=A0A507BP92_9FUNG|nr:uncharacterized protein SmJEL517_g05440 [Synchytrium microbalum]TPX31207.1 hypothetical protein SmJEL517_g05440 [Synchytrium microbalum]